MTVLRCIHHINFIVADLDAAIDNYQDLLGIGPFEIEDLPQRGVSTARARVGDVWLVLVAPHGGDSDAGRYLRDHGEGFFLMSFGVHNVDLALSELAQRGAVPAGRKARAGISGWQVADLETESRLGVRFHVTQPG